MVRTINKYSDQVTSGESGFTLIEQVVTLAIVAMVLTAAMAALATGGLSLNVASSRNEAMSLAQAQLECIKNASYPVSETACDMSTSRYTLSTSINGVDCTDEPLDPTYDANVQKIEVTVSRGPNEVLCVEDLKVGRP